MNGFWIWMVTCVVTSALTSAFAYMFGHTSGYTSCAKAHLAKLDAIAEEQVEFNRRMVEVLGKERRS